MTSATVTFIRFLLTLETWGGVTTPADLVSRGVALASERRRRPDGVRTDRDAASQGVDMLIDTAPDGRAQLPGTSIAGLLQQRMFDLGVLEEDRLAIFGKGKDQNSAESAVASPLWAFDAVATNDEAKPSTRNTTAVDRQRGAPRTRTLRAAEGMPIGTQFEVFLRWDGDLDEHCEALLKTIGSWRPRVGAGVSTGRGLCKVSELTIGSLDLAREDDFLTWLQSSGPELVRAVATEPRTVTPPTSDEMFSLRWAIDGPLLVVGGTKDESRGNLLRGMRQDGKALIPGSTIKGAVRSRMEYILRSAGRSVCGDDADAPGCGSCLPCVFFGHSADENSISVGRRGMAIPHDATVEDGTPFLRVHGAIDRFTGGNAQRGIVRDGQHTGDRKGMLFAVEATEGGTFTMRFDISALTKEKRAAFKNLLRLVADDFTDGLLGIGHGTHGGYGTIALHSDSSGRLPGRGDALTWLASDAAGPRETERR